MAGLTSFALRWVEQLLARYNAFGPSSLGDRRRGNGAAPTVLTAPMLAAVRERLKRPPEDGGVWTARKVAAFMAGELGRAVAEQRGWGLFNLLPVPYRAVTEQASRRTAAPPR